MRNNKIEIADYADSSETVKTELKKNNFKENQQY